MERGRESEFIRFLERIHEVHSIERKTSRGICVVRGRLANIQGTNTPDNVWPEEWTKIGKATDKREEKEWVNEKPKLDNARRLRCISFIDPEDGEYKETIKNARRKLEVHVGAAFKVTSFIVITMNLKCNCMCLKNREEESLGWAVVLLSHFFFLLLCCFPPLPLWVVLLSFRFL